MNDRLHIVCSGFQRRDHHTNSLKPDEVVAQGRTGFSRRDATTLDVLAATLAANGRFDGD
jgi:hypothetical protein